MFHFAGKRLTFRLCNKQIVCVGRSTSPLVLPSRVEEACKKENGVSPVQGYQASLLFEFGGGGLELTYVLRHVSGLRLAPFCFGERSDPHLQPFDPLHAAGNQTTPGSTLRARKEKQLLFRVQGRAQTDRKCFDAMLLSGCIVSACNCSAPDVPPLHSYFQTSQAVSALLLPMRQRTEEYSPHVCFA